MPNVLLTATTEPELNSAFVCIMGMGIVFIGLICIILLCKIMSAVIRIAEGKSAQAPAAPVASAAAAPAVASDEIPNRQEFVAAVAAAIAEDMGTDISAIRIHSIKKI